MSDARVSGDANARVPWDDLDPGIREVVAALVDEGFETVASCQGHGEGDAWVVCELPRGEVYDEFARLHDTIRKLGWAAHCVVSLEIDVASTTWWLKARWWGRVPFRG